MSAPLSTQEEFAHSADDLLWRWGSWSRHSIGLGYASENPISRVMREGPGAGHLTVAADIAMPKDIEFCETTVLRMSAHVRRAIKMRYIRSMTDKDGAKACHCSTKTYRDRITLGINYLAGRLSGIN